MKLDNFIKRTMSNIVVDPLTQCWNWQGSLDNGYGRLYWNGKKSRAHRWFYEQRFGNLPEWNHKGDPEIDHICRNRACVNPEHLRLVSPKENVLAGIGPTAVNARKTTCKYGHPLVPDNRGHRKCVECQRIYEKTEKRRTRKHIKNPPLLIY